MKPQTSKTLLKSKEKPKSKTIDLNEVMFNVSSTSFAKIGETNSKTLSHENCSFLEYAAMPEMFVI